MHPLARPNNLTGMYDMKAGDQVQHIDGRIGIADEFTSDGDAFVTWEDGKVETVKSISLFKLTL